MDNKDRYLILCYPKLQKFSPSHWFNIYFTRQYMQWNSFVPSTWFGLLLPLSQPLSFWACSQLDFYTPPLVFYPIPPALSPKAHVYQQQGPHKLSCHLRWCHRCSIGLRSGDCAGHFRTLMLLSLNHFEASFEVCLGSLSCWKMMVSLSNP